MNSTFGVERGDRRQTQPIGHENIDRGQSTKMDKGLCF